MIEQINEILAKYELKNGAHASLNEGSCVMELVSYIAGEPWSDSPQCACPILTKFAIRYNDCVGDIQRQKLKELIPLLLNSRNKKLELKRARFFALQAVTVFLPILTEALELKEITEKLRLFTSTQLREACDYINLVKPQIKKAATADAYAAYAYVYAAAATVAATVADTTDTTDTVGATADAYAATADTADAIAEAYAYAVNIKKSLWLDVRQKIWDAGFEALKEACEIRE